jgi:hypothetical protein
MASVQFRGISNVLKAYNYKEVEVWAIFEGKRLQHKGNGETELTEYLNLLALGGSNATLILKIYEEITDPREVKSNTADDGSFSFKMMDIDEDPDYQFRSTRSQSMGRLGDVLLKMDERLQLLESGIDEPEGIGKALETAMIGAIEDPQKLGAMIDIIKGLFSTGPKPVAALGNVHRITTNEPLTVDNNPAQATSGNEYEQRETEKTFQDQVKRLGAAIDTLSEADPRLVVHLEKLAAVASRDPKKFQGLISMIDFL